MDDIWIMYGIYIYIYWLVVTGTNYFTCFSIGNVIIPIDQSFSEGLVYQPVFDGSSKLAEQFHKITIKPPLNQYWLRLILLLLVNSVYLVLSFMNGDLYVSGRDVLYELPSGVIKHGRLEYGPLIGDCPFKTFIHRGFSIDMLRCLITRGYTL